MESMRSCLVAYVSTFKIGGCDTCKMEKLEIRAAIKYSCKTGMPRKEIHEDLIESLGKVSSKNRQQSLRAGESALRMMDGLAAPKMPRMMKISKWCTPWLYLIGGENCEAKLAKWA